jgi:hypothetical protein
MQIQLLIYCLCLTLSKHSHIFTLPSIVTVSFRVVALIALPSYCYHVSQKHVSSVAAIPNKRLKVASCNTASQPIELNTQLLLPCTLPRYALIEAS